MKTTEFATRAGELATKLHALCCNIAREVGPDDRKIAEVLLTAGIDVREFAHLPIVQASIRLRVGPFFRLAWLRNLQVNEIPVALTSVKALVNPRVTVHKQGDMLTLHTTAQYRGAFSAATDAIVQALTNQIPCGIVASVVRSDPDLGEIDISGAVTD